MKNIQLNATTHKVEVNCDFSASDTCPLIEQGDIQKNFTPQLYEQLQNLNYDTVSLLRASFNLFLNIKKSISLPERF